LIVSQFTDQKLQQLCPLRSHDIAMSRFEGFGELVLEDSTGMIRYG
jgi:hypothetical protein